MPRPRNETLPRQVRALSSKQIATLRYIAAHDTTLDVCRNLNRGTLYSLLHRGYLSNHRGVLELTTSGSFAMKSYNSQAANWRTYEGDLTDRVHRLIEAARAKLEKAG